MSSDGGGVGWWPLGGQVVAAYGGGVESGDGILGFVSGYGFVSVLYIYFFSER